MKAKLLSPLAHCRNFTEMAQVLVESELYNHDFTSCIIADIGKDGRVRESGRYGLLGPGLSAEPLPLSDRGLLFKALKKSKPTVIENALELAGDHAFTPNNDLDETLLINEFQTIVIIPIRSFGLLNGVIGLASISNLKTPLELNYDYQKLQSILTLATRSIAYTENNVQKDPSPFFTTRDKGVLGLIANGSTNKEISRELNLSLPTVKLCVSNLIAKLGVSGRQAASDKARELGITN